MANLILKEAGWEERIRNRLGVDEAYLPDSVIQKPDVIDVAEAFIIDEVEDYEKILESSDSVWLESATVCQCAIILCDQMDAKLPTRQQSPHMSHEISVDWQAKKDSLIGERNFYLSKIVTDTEVKHFGLSE